MAYKVLRSKDTQRDLALIFDHLVDSHIALGEQTRSAFERASHRTEKIENDMLLLGKAPFQGTLRPELMPGLRNVTKDKAIFYFTVHEDLEEVRVLAVFFGGQDHVRKMLMRLG
jgi:plasmid stabilization system protein ParE